MMRVTGTLAGLLVLASTASAELELRDIQAVHGPLGPPRESLEFYPLDEIVFRFQVAGLQTDAKGRCEAELSFRLTNPQGQMVLNQSGPVQQPLMLAGDTVPSHVRVAVGPSAPAGDYQLVVTFRDKLSNESVSFERTLTCKPATFQILTPRFSHDKEGKIPAGLRGLVGESLHFQLKVVGFDRTQEKIHTVMTAQVLDQTGAELLPEPIVINAEVTDPQQVPQVAQLNFSGAVGLNRPGEFTLRITVEDQLGTSSDTFEAPLEVEMP